MRGVTVVAGVSAPLREGVKEGDSRSAGWISRGGVGEAGGETTTRSAKEGLDRTAVLETEAGSKPRGDVGDRVALLERSEATARRGRLLGDWRVVVGDRGGRGVGGSACAVFSYRKATRLESSLKGPNRFCRDLERTLAKIGGAIRGEEAVPCVGLRWLAMSYALTSQVSNGVGGAVPAQRSAFCFQVGRRCR